MVDAEFRSKHIASAGWRWKNVRAVPLAGEDGSIEKCSGMNLDIHDRKLAEEAVRESEERLKSATEVGRKFSLVFELEKLEEVRARGMCLLGAQPSLCSLCSRLATFRRSIQRSLVHIDDKAGVLHGEDTHVPSYPCTSEADAAIFSPSACLTITTGSKCHSDHNQIDINFA